MDWWWQKVVGRMQVKMASVARFTGTSRYVRYELLEEYEPNGRIERRDYHNNVSNDDLDCRDNEHITIIIKQDHPSAGVYGVQPYHIT
jgi:hypothetical protein